MFYTKFRTVCLKCDKKLDVSNFNVHIGMHSFALCPKHLEEAIKTLKKYIGVNFYD